MHFSRLLRTIILGLINLFGGLILVGFAAWIHYRINGPYNPGEIALEDWSLALAIYTVPLQLGAAIEAIIIGLCTRFRWIKVNHGRLAVGAFSLISLYFAISAIWVGMTSRYSNLFGVLLYEFIITLPLWLAWGLLFLLPHRQQRRKNS
ncbi:hypothetical protein D0962_15020 [Leptolyngbyaceae cyanobacterium CCMR0082]|uniref:Uncharacterized protein n=1 Tax=Adonisia turfae CCMR0082 TaxID=2304604 RepID=A0A6M0S6I7_9CYAN|nr:hypothetical protein [Adonisia turfae]MDV3348818.1 hypothetical protein [Leptothoe sp. LEGE 181152]NEZ64084.1 hypothetical protein [Adonisia turfae CCMR0082]